MRKTCLGMFTLGLVLALTGVTMAQPIGLPPGGGGGTGDPIEASIPDVTVAPNTMFELKIEVTDLDPIQGIIATVDTNPADIQFMSATQGQGVLNYLAANGEPPQCDIIADAMSVFALIFFNVPYELAVYGTEILVINAVSPATPGTYSINYMIDSMGMTTAGSTTITVANGNVPPKELVRGDVNNDGTCNISDPISLLTYLFAGGAVPNCFDAADLDDDGQVGIADAVNLLSGIFGTGFPMDEECKADLTADGLGDCDRDDCQ